MTSAKNLLDAFNTIVGVVGAGTGIAGLVSPNPRDARFDKADADLARIGQTLDDLTSSVESMSKDVMAEFDRLTQRDIARVSVETAEEQLH